ncbi:MAG: KpsF/GutQ family sugar-phosphate isomerase [Planctomycetota bacterium]
MTIEYARKILKTEVKAIESLIERIDENFLSCINAIISCTGRVVVTGMGKPGIIAQKISATLASTGTPSLFLHPAEAIHGDLGRVLSNDIVLMLSNSGETAEIIRLIEPIKKIGSKIVAITGAQESTLAKNSDILLNIGSIAEACPLKLAPSASTTAMLALGDAVALTVMQRRTEKGNFTIEDYAAYHPGRSIGRKLLKVTEVMRKGEAAPVVTENATVEEAILAITRARAGAAVVIDCNNKITGIFTDGDLRRYVRKQHNIHSDKITSGMTKNPRKIPANKLAAEAHSIMTKLKIGELPVVDDNDVPVGVVNLKDITGINLSE